MAVEATQPVGARNQSAMAAIRQAAQVTGASFSYLVATARVESNLNPSAAAKTSSAGGLFQFIDRTWLGTLKEAGPHLGYDRYSDAITRTEDGRYVINNPAMRDEIMALRQDPTANALMAGVFTNSNAKHLTNNLGRAPSDGELYLAHFMGATGASRLLSMAQSNPGGQAADAFPVAARANRSIFFDQSGRARSFSEVARNLTSRFDVAQARKSSAEAAQAMAAPQAATMAFMPQMQSVAQPQPSAAVAQRPQPAESMFHNPYRQAPRREAVSNTVAQLWTGRERTSQQDMARQMALELEGRTRPRADAPRPVQAEVRYAPQSASQPQAVAQTREANTASNGALGLFQDAAPDVRSLFTHGVRG